MHAITCLPAWPLAPRAHMQKRLEQGGTRFMTAKAVRTLATALQAACPLPGRVFSDVKTMRVCEVRERLGARAHPAVRRPHEIPHQCAYSGCEVLLRKGCNARDHVRTHHTPAPLVQCKACTKKFWTGHARDFHWAADHAPYRFECRHCHKRPPSSSRVREHIKRYHQDCTKACCSTTD